LGKIGGDGFVSLNEEDINSVLDAKTNANPVKRALAARARTSEFSRALQRQESSVQTQSIV